jgi:hypothetical protein
LWALLQEFPDGITNGAHWYPVYGGMQVGHPDTPPAATACWMDCLQVFRPVALPPAEDDIKQHAHVFLVCLTCWGSAVAAVAAEFLVGLELCGAQLLWDHAGAV